MPAASQTPNVPARLDVVAAAVKPIVQIPNTEIAAEVIRFNEEATKAVAVADRAVISDAQSAGNAADVIRAINGSMKKLSAAKDGRVSTLKSVLQQLANLYGVPNAQYEKAKATLTTKVNTWRREEEVRLAKVAEERRKQREEEARRLAEAQASLGDQNGAQQILEEAAALDFEPEKVSATGTYGATLGSTSRHIGEVVDRSVFFRTLADSKDPLVIAIAEKIEFPKQLLNALAKAVNTGETIAPPGFKADTQSSSNIR